jgi:RNA polymerase sigma-70 factor (ECF subfamily)
LDYSTTNCQPIDIMPATSISFIDRLTSAPTKADWDLLVRIYSPLLTKWIEKYDIQLHDAEDIKQQVFAALMAELPSFKHNRRTGAFRKWLRLTLVFRIRSFWDSRKRHPKTVGSTAVQRFIELESDTSELSQIWNTDHDKLVLNKLQEMVRPRFGEQTWRAFCRQFFDRQHPKTVAIELDMELASVYQAQSRVLKALREAGRGMIDEI